MKNYALRTAFFLFCFAVGNETFWCSGFSMFKAGVSGSSDIKPEIKYETVVKKRRGKGLEVKFKNFVDTGDGLTADFEITNFESES